VSTPKMGAPGDEPAAAPATSSGGTPDVTDVGGVAGDAPVRRRRGNRGGRRHKKPAAEEQALGRETAAAEPPKAQGSTPRDGYAAAADLPTAPLIPVGAAGGARGRGRDGAQAAAAGRSGGGEVPAAEDQAAQPSGRTRSSRSRRKPRTSEAAGAVAPTAVEAAVAAQPAPAPAAPVEPEGTAPAGGAGHDGDGEQPPPKRRRRGSRGGRRRHKSADIEHEEAAREAEEAAGEPAPPHVAAEEPLPRAAAAVAAAEPAAVAEAASARAAEPAGGESAEAEEDETGAKRRRRGARGGRRTRGRRAAGEEGAEAGEASEAPAEAGGAEPAARKAGPAASRKAAAAADPEAKVRGRQRDRRRPRAIVRQDEGSGLGTMAPIELGQRRSTVIAERPERKIILVTDDGEELRVALVEDGRLSEIYIERPDRKSYLGDIYQGKVENVMSGIDAAFVDFGLEKNGFLYVDEVTTPEGEKRARRITDALKNGQQVLVQVIKDPMGHKGARLSTKISLAGRYLVYVPGGSGVGVSRRLKQGERERLRDISKELKPKDAGLIVRTIAEGHGLEDLKRDMRYLARLWARLKKKSETVKAPGLVHKEVDISLEVTRDLFNDTCESLIVDDAKRHKAILSFLDKEAPELLPKVHLHTGEEPLFVAYGIDDQIAKALERRVPLPSGGNLMIDHAEALTVIDVNTGRFTRGKGLEDTITKTNLEAAREVVRQLRLRDIGGIIIIDFIDMAHAKNREMVLATLEAELETDRTKTYVVELSPLGLVEMTRQNTTDGARGILTRACPSCSGKGRVLSEETMALSVERRVRALARKSQAKAWLIEVNGAVADRLSGARLKRLEKQTGRRVFLEGGSALPVDSFRVISEGSLAHVEEQRVPVKEGQEVTVELEFSLTYSPRDAVGYVDGYMVIVEGGRQHLGKRRKVRVTEIARTGAHATVLKKDTN
jgi:ribonuclease G